MMSSIEEQLFFVAELSKSVCITRCLFSALIYLFVLSDGRMEGTFLDLRLPVS